MKVKTVNPHNNGYGEKFEKAKGDVYSLPDKAAQTLIKARLVVEAEEDKKAFSAKPGGKSGGNAK